MTQIKSLLPAVTLSLTTLMSITFFTICHQCCYAASANASQIQRTKTILNDRRTLNAANSNADKSLEIVSNMSGTEISKQFRKAIALSLDSTVTSTGNYTSLSELSALATYLKRECSGNYHILHEKSETIATGGEATIFQCRQDESDHKSEDRSETMNDINKQKNNTIIKVSGIKYHEKTQSQSLSETEADSPEAKDFNSDTKKQKDIQDKLFHEKNVMQKLSDNPNTKHYVPNIKGHESIDIKIRKEDLDLLNQNLDRSQNVSPATNCSTEYGHDCTNFRTQRQSSYESEYGESASWQSDFLSRPCSPELPSMLSPTVNLSGHQICASEETESNSDKMSDRFGSNQDHDASFERNLKLEGSDTSVVSYAFSDVDSDASIVFEKSDLVDNTTASHSIDSQPLTHKNLQTLNNGNESDHCHCQPSVEQDQSQYSTTGSKMAMKNSIPKDSRKAVNADADSDFIEFYHFSIMKMPRFDDNLTNWIKSSNYLNFSEDQHINERRATKHLLEGYLQISNSQFQFVHHDLKPDNILINRLDGHSLSNMITDLRISDFGLAKPMYDKDSLDNKFNHNDSESSNTDIDLIKKAFEKQRQYKQASFETKKLNALNLNGPCTISYTPAAYHSQHDVSSDLFSLGLIIIEIFYKAECFMEKSVEVFEPIHAGDNEGKNLIDNDIINVRGENLILRHNRIHKQKRLDRLNNTTSLTESELNILIEELYNEILSEITVTIGSSDAIGSDAMSRTAKLIYNGVIKTKVFPDHMDVTEKFGFPTQDSYNTFRKNLYVLLRLNSATAPKFDNHSHDIDSFVKILKNENRRQLVNGVANRAMKSIIGILIV